MDPNGHGPAAKSSRARIVEAAAALMYERGVRGATVDEVLAAADAGKGQFYHYFQSKEELVREAGGSCSAHQARGAVAAAARAPSVATA